MGKIQQINALFSVGQHANKHSQKKKKNKRMFQNKANPVGQHSDRSPRCVAGQVDADAPNLAKAIKGG